jgi:hypothetical protein
MRAAGVSTARPVVVYDEGSRSTRLPDTSPEHATAPARRTSTRPDASSIPARSVRPSRSSASARASS